MYKRQIYLIASFTAFLHCVCIPLDAVKSLEVSTTSFILVMTSLVNDKKVSAIMFPLDKLKGPHKQPLKLFMQVDHGLLHLQNLTVKYHP